MGDVANLEALLTRGCTWLNSYLITTPTDLQKLTTCQTPERTRAAAPFLVTESEELAKSGKINEAIQGLTTAKQWDPSLTFDPVTRANQLAQEGKAQAEKEAKIQQLQQQVLEQINNKQFQSALATLRQLATLAPEDQDAGLWNGLCWDGSLNGQARLVLPACEEAVKLAPGDTNIQDSRGLARALTGNIPGAITDFEAYIQSPGITPERKKQRQRWVDALRSGQSPSKIFTPQVLEELKNQ